MNTHVNPRCIGCGHRRPVAGNWKDSYHICHYILDTGMPRGCPVEECNHYTTEECHIIDDFRFLEIK